MIACLTRAARRVESRYISFAKYEPVLAWILALTISTTLGTWSPGRIPVHRHEHGKTPSPDAFEWPVFVALLVFGVLTVVHRSLRKVWAAGAVVAGAGVSPSAPSTEQRLWLPLLVLDCYGVGWALKAVVAEWHAACVRSDEDEYLPRSTTDTKV